MFVFLLLIIISSGLFAQSPNLPGGIMSGEYLEDIFAFFDSDPRGDAAVAERYALWGKAAAEEGRWSEALAAMERAADFSDVSSDISYLLALARSQENKPRAAVLEALNRALAVNRWTLYDQEEARFFLVENLIAIRAWPEALAELGRVRRGPREAELTLRVLAASRPAEFRTYMAESLDRYPRESGPVRVFFDFIGAQDYAGRDPEAEDLQLLELILRRLPVLLADDPELAWMAAPFTRNLDDARRLILAYRALNEPVPASIAAALNLGVIGEESALEELFSRETLDLHILDEVWGLLRYEGARAQFRRYLELYSGVIIEDADRDGIPETTAEYHRGVLQYAAYNPSQDGIPDMIVYFEAGEPRRALILLPPDGSQDGRPAADLLWEEYPAILEAELEGARFIPRPADFFYQPFWFENLWSSGVYFPRRDTLSPPLSRRVLVAQALRIERPSREFNGGIEVIELNMSIPIRAREYVGDLLVSETEFLRGRPQLQRVDLNLDGRMDTVRRFSRDYRYLEPHELWDYDRDIESTFSDWDGE